jgi:curved DNA-binding protein CbpA
MDLRRAYRVLGLPEGAAPQEVQAAWRDLAQVWHPDRFPAGSRLRAKAEENLKRINEAHDALKDLVPAAAPGLAARVRTSVMIGLGDLRDSVFTQAPPVGLRRRTMQVLGLGPQRTGEFLRRRPFSAARLWLSMGVFGVLAAALAALLLLR